MKVGFAIALLAVATLCSCTLAQETAEDWYKKGQDLNRNGSWEEAVKAYDEAIELEPNNATFYIAKVPSLKMLAIITNNQSKRNESLEAVNKALQIDSKNPSAWELKGEVLSQMKRYNESLEAYGKAIENIGSYRQDVQLNQTEFLSYIWTSKSISLWQLMRYNESLEAVDKAVKIDPAGNYDAWAFKGELLASLGRYNESLQAFDGAAAIGTAGSRPELEALPLEKEGYVLMQMGQYEEADQIYQKIISLNLTGEGADRRLADAWRGRGNALAKLGEYNESLQAFDKAIELNPERTPYAWTGKGDALLASGRYDEAIISYDQALKLYPEFADAGIAHAQKGKGDSLTKLGKRDEALAAYGVAVGSFDKAIKAFNNATPLDKATSFTFDPYPLDTNFWNSRGSVLKTLGRQSEADAAFAKAKGLGYEVPNQSETNVSSTSVKMLAITKIKATGEDEFVVVANSRAAAQSLNSWTLDVSDGRNGSRNQSITLPDFIIDPDERINVHLGKGESNETDVFLNSAITLNDTAGNVTLKDETGMSVASFEYRVEPDGSITCIMTAEGEFSYPQSDSNEVKMVVREAGSGPYVTERTEYEPEAAYNWVDKGNALAEHGNYEEAIKALDNATKLNPQDKHIWMSKGLIFAAHLGRYNESIEAYERAIQIDPNDADAWFGKGVALNKTGRYEEASQALNETTDLDPKLVAAWKVKGDALRALGRNSEADAAFAKAEELGYKR